MPPVTAPLPDPATEKWEQLRRLAHILAHSPLPEDATLGRRALHLIEALDAFADTPAPDKRRPDE
jgi:hypothetical protein